MSRLSGNGDSGNTKFVMKMIFSRHVDYIYFNPVKHGHVQRAVDRAHSTFHRYVCDGVYAHD
ncbi:hypothetical protein [Candidatus Nitrotoga sp. BS]|uniref:hypothetical protein n=1 Tax=Candidatus Nitrotoga sp. BS TaxID=2890408 RepID=UPI001EF1F356